MNRPRWTAISVVIPCLALAAPSPLHATQYVLQPVVQTAELGITTVDREISINNSGNVAFVGRFYQPSAGRIIEQIFVGNGTPGQTQSITPSAGGLENETFAPAVQISDQNEVLCRRAFVISGPLGPQPFSFVETWNALVPDQRHVLVTGEVLVGDFDKVHSYPSINNSGGICFMAQDGSSNLLGTLTSAGGYTIGLSGELRRPVIADNNSFVFRSGAAPYSIQVRDHTFSLLATIASTATGFSYVGFQPVISDDGTAVAFTGTDGTGNGIFLSVQVGGVFQPPVKIIGLRGNGRFEPGERWEDANGNGMLESGEDNYGFTDLFLDDRLGLSVTHSGTRHDVQVCFRARFEGLVGVHTMRAFFTETTTPGTPPIHVLDHPSLVARAFDTFGDGPAMRTISDVRVYDSLNDLGQVTFWAQLAEGGEAILKADPVRTPVLLLPGIVGTGDRVGESSQNFRGWLVTRGPGMQYLQEDPIAGAYNDIIQTLRNSGYEPSPASPAQDLYVVAYDWRLPLAPLDGIEDGTLTNVTAASITDASLEYGTDYLGQALWTAAEKWRTRYGRPLQEVDIIGHSMGGLLARAYLQSNAYGVTTPGGTPLPRVARFFSCAVPHLGAPKSINPWTDNWAADPTYIYVMSKMLSYAWGTVKDGCTISGPTPINLASISTGGVPDPIRMIEQYAPTVGQLLPSYDAIEDGAPVGRYRNDFLLDLNRGFDQTTGPGAIGAAGFANRSRPFVFGGPARCTITRVRQRVGPHDDARIRFQNFTRSDVGSGETYFEDLPCELAGDGTVPTESSISWMMGDPRISLFDVDAEHMTIMAHPELQERLVRFLTGRTPAPGIISTGLANSIWNATTYVADLYSRGRCVPPSPADAPLVSALPSAVVLIDGMGRRLGYSTADGALDEIPGSIWIGGADGMGIASSQLLPPVRLELSGPADEFEAMAALASNGVPFGASYLGSLAAGQFLSLPIVDPTVSVNGPNPGPEGPEIRAVRRESTTAIEVDVRGPEGWPLEGVVADVQGRRIARMEPLVGSGRWQRITIPIGTAKAQMAFVTLRSRGSSMTIKVPLLR